jgi:hypothetical protein
MSISKKLATNLRMLKKHPAVRRFIRHNRRVFSAATGAAQKRPVVLFELNAMQSAHIAYSYLANMLAKENDAAIKAYFPRAHANVREKLLFRLRALFGLNETGVYKSFGATESFGISPSKAQKVKARRLFDGLQGKLRSRGDIEALTINGVWVGDLIYDSYLMTHLKPTIDIASFEFRKFLLTSLELLAFWEDYFAEHDVRAINVSHCVYNLAMPLRIAVQKGIPAFQANATHVYRLSPGKLFAYNEFVHYREHFSALPAETRKAGLAEAEGRIRRRFAGEVGVDMAYSTKSAYGEARHQRLLRESSRKKILIATHCFFDSPHSYGNNIFPDFYEWLDFLGKISEETDYDWYIKTHPDFLPGTKEIIDGFVARYPKFTLLPSDASHNQIIAEGISVALTVYGTIALEYAALGVPVINASQNNPHIAYHFNLHAKDVEDYRRMLMGLDSLNLEIDRLEVLEYYYMRHIHDAGDLFFESYQETKNGLGGYDAQFSPLVYDKWLAEWTPEKHEAILSDLRSFVRSGNFRMGYSDPDQEQGNSSGKGAGGNSRVGSGKEKS